jgi:predicted flap endonuclease-1-like 5' DNA nuclease
VKSGTIKIDASADAPLVDAEVRKLGDSLPRQAAGVEGEGRHDGRRPYGLAAPRGGAPDDLKRIRGIGPQNEGRLHALGIWHFGQIAAWSAENAKWIGSYLAFRGRIERERWIDQAKELAAGRNTKFLPGANVRKIATPKDRSRPAQG